MEVPTFFIKNFYHQKMFLFDFIVQPIIFHQNFCNSRKWKCVYEQSTINGRVNFGGKGDHFPF